ncbi:MAG TPA: terpene cyclase/mutase family protein [Pirellulaceae bacterium]|nr:terpene cyclase/mutase family protein [Pirellulaceae bacterium]HMO93951.1 terpene cyclase/mutase family protein [Pirellulaceae bacterium]HMP67957.1 terpene cyclase/mutase family protein [Pirellulaceae bacterium]
MSRLFNYLLMAMAACATLRCEQLAAQDQPSNQPTSQAGVIDDPYDFSTVPEIPDFQHPSEQEIKSAIQRGIQFLLRDQNKDGSWGSYVTSRDFEIYAPVPGAHYAFRSAVTAMCVMALLDSGEKSPEVQDAMERGIRWLLENLPKVKRANGDAIYNVWSHCYALECFGRLAVQEGLSEEKLSSYRLAMNAELDRLNRYESIDGGWGYYDFRAQTRQPSGDSISFVNASILIAMRFAEHAGVEPNENVVKRAVNATLRQQKRDLSYLYGEYLRTNPMLEINRPGGSLARSQACNLAMRWYGDEKITDNVIKIWLIRLYTRNGWLDIGRKLPIPHESWMQVSGYFYYYGHYYAGLCIMELPVEERAPYQAMLARILVDRQEKNGCWWDYPMYNYHRQYGTAYALMALQRCLP